MQVAKPMMGVASHINPDVIHKVKPVLDVNLMPIAHLKELTAMLMDLAKIAEVKVTMEPAALVDPFKMVLLVLLAVTATAILSQEFVLISVSRTLIVWMPANPGVNLSVVAVSNALTTFTVLFLSGEVLRRL